MGLARFLIRLGLAFSFFYAAYASFQNPTSWIGFFPQRLRDLAGAETLLTVFSIYEIILGLWLLSGKKVVYAGLLASATLFGIAVFNWGAMEIVFRDISLGLAALALASLAPKRAT